jgi:manganese-transporting P-type ATPase
VLDSTPGDGVNDVAAMKTADVAVSFLNGFGDEKGMGEDIDFDDDRRRKKVRSQRLGSQRLAKQSERRTQTTEDQERINQLIETAQAEVRAKAAARAGLDPDSKDVKFEFEDVKELMSASLRVMKEERKRQKSLRRGGGDAARILAEERRRANPPTESETVAGESIKPGEASLVAPFSCLHPSIDGVDAVLRASIATTASALATQELISLHSLMACANMASLYREGVRYGKQMMLVENMFYMLVDQQRCQQSRIPRPRIPSSPSMRPPISMFHPAAMLRTMGQAALNLITMNVAVRYAKELERKSGTHAAFLLQLRGDHPRKLSQILTAIASSAAKESNTIDATAASVFRRPPFRPNYETNVIFLFSVLQNMLVSLTSHRGHPFSRGVLESGAFSSFAVGVAAFCVVCVVESSPKLNSLLQLKRLPDRKSRLVLLGLVVFNTLACLGFNWLLGGTCDLRSSSSSDDTFAADLEERLLKEESDRNLRRCYMGIGLIGYLASSAIV